MCENDCVYIRSLYRVLNSQEMLLNTLLADHQETSRLGRANVEAIQTVTNGHLRVIRQQLQDLDQGVHYVWQQCPGCGAYRYYKKLESGECVPVGGCRACDTIERLRDLLENNVVVRTGSLVTQDIENLQRRLALAEQEVERLKESRKPWV